MGKIRRARAPTSDAPEVRPYLENPAMATESDASGVEWVRMSLGDRHPPRLAPAAWTFSAAGGALELLQNLDDLEQSAGDEFVEAAVHEIDVVLAEVVGAEGGDEEAGDDRLA